MPTDHEPATVSLKVLLLIFGVVLVGTLTYLVWAQNSAPDITDYSSNKTATKTKDTTEPTTSTNGTTTTKNTTPPTTDPCKDKKTYTMPIEKLSACYPEFWQLSTDLSGGPQIAEQLSLKYPLRDSVKGIFYLYVSALVVKESTVTEIEDDHKLLDSFTLGGSTVYLMSNIQQPGITRLSSCNSVKICAIPAKNTPGTFLEVFINNSLPGSYVSTQNAAIEIVKSLHY